MQDKRCRTSSLLLIGLMAVGCRDAPVNPPPLSTQVLQPTCDTPAPLRGTFDARAPGYLVLFHDSVAVQAEVTRLSAQYQFTPRAVWEHALRGFAAELTPRAVAGLRCELTVASVEYDGIATVAGRQGVLPN